jgi:hypothetical protein
MQQLQPPEMNEMGNVATIDLTALELRQTEGLVVGPSPGLSVPPGHARA